MSKYDPLKAFLISQVAQNLPMTFAEIEKILGFKLPASARDHQAWWANESTGHVQARAWMAAGFETGQVDIDGKKVVFRRAPTSTGMREEPRLFEPAKGEADNKPMSHPAFGALKGLLVIEPGYDLTQPSIPPEEWEEIEAEMLAKFDRAFGR